MNGTFTYSNQPLVMSVGLSGAVLTGCLMAFHSLLAIPALFLTILLTVVLEHIPGHYEADSERVTFQILWKPDSFAYHELRVVKTETAYGGKSRLNDTFRVTVTLTLRTDDGVHSFCSQHSFSVSDQIKNPDRFKAQMDELDFIQLGRYIESRMQPQEEVRR